MQTVQSEADTLLLGKPYFETWSVYMGIAQIDFDPPPLCILPVNSEGMDHGKVSLNRQGQSWKDWANLKSNMRTTCILTALTSS